MSSKDENGFYDRHARKEELQAKEGVLPSHLVNPDAVMAWRPRRMCEMLRPLLELNPDARWITLGDGNYGSDAFYLQQQGIDVLATSLTDSSLRVAAEKGVLKSYASVNAEDIPYSDASFDYVLCKEAYHHFPRPAISFYEMLRVAKKAVVLIEPYDGPRRLLDVIKGPVKRLLWGKNETIDFEPSGNYIYRVNPKEMEKKLAAMGYPTMAYKTFNDIYIPQLMVSQEKCSTGYIVTKIAIFLQDVLCKLHLLNPAMLILVAFKTTPASEAKKKLLKNRFEIVSMPVNPYSS